MSAAAASRRNAGSVVVNLMLEDLEGSIGRFSNDFCQFPMWEQRERYI
jgi:hypothetical protein